MPVEIRPAGPADLPAILDLLRVNRLHLGNVEAAVGDFLVAEEEGRIVGTVGLEVRRPFALLRSAAILPARQRSGLGGELVTRIVAFARSRELESLYLFTPTAERFFARHGFQRIARETIPVPLHSTSQYAHACGQTAVPMHLDLTA